MRIYNDAEKILHTLGYSKFTKLQEKVFNNERAFTKPCPWTFVIGSTSSGKTLIPLVRYFHKYIDGQRPRMLFAVPYRALAAQKYKEITAAIEKMGLDINVVISTGEFRSADHEVFCGNADIAVIIYEKIFMFSCMDDAFLKKYNILVMDEVGLVHDQARGVKVDLLFARAKYCTELEVMALATPYYDWSLYLKEYGFDCIREDDRPVKIKTFPVHIVKRNKEREIVHIEEDCHALQCGPLHGQKKNIDYTNPRQWWDEIVEDVCVYHLRLGHKILIFINNREEVRKLSKRLCDNLIKRNCIEQWIDISNTQDYVLKKMNLDIEDAEDLYGVLEQEDYVAFSYGIGYHNASVPNSLRILIEEEMLDSTGHLKVVCCTETLAYGINSNVDVVIIPDMIKQRPGEIPSLGFLTSNEYMNYAGRAGRLREEVVENQIGYVYTILRVSNINTVKPTNKLNQKEEWERLCHEIETPTKIVSRFFYIDQEEKPFYLLSMFPHSRNSINTISIDQIVKQIKHMPAPDERAFDLQMDIREPLTYLLEKHLICASEFDEDFEEENEEYCLTDAGAGLTGYIIRKDDFESVLCAVKNSIVMQELLIGDLIYAILNIKELRYEISGSIGTLFKLVKNSEDTVKVILTNTYKQLFETPGTTSADIQDLIKEIVVLDTINGVLNEKNVSVKMNKNCDCLRLTAAFLFWISPACTVKKLYDRYKIGYPQMQKLAEKISYYLDIVQYALPIVQIETGDTLMQSLGRKTVQEIQEQIRELSKAIYYQFSPQMSKLFGMEVDTPAKARFIRRLTKYYLFFERKNKRNKNLSRKEKKYVDKIKDQISKLPSEQRDVFTNLMEEL